MEQDRVRAEFEAWHREKYPEQDVRKQNLLGTYTFIIVEQRWECWQASREAVVVELPTSEFFDDGENEYGYKVSAEAYRADATLDAIHAAGIRTK